MNSSKAFKSKLSTFASVDTKRIPFPPKKNGFIFAPVIKRENKFVFQLAFDLVKKSEFDVETITTLNIFRVDDNFEEEIFNNSLKTYSFLKNNLNSPSHICNKTIPTEMEILIKKTGEKKLFILNKESFDVLDVYMKDILKALFSYAETEQEESLEDLEIEYFFDGNIDETELLISPYEDPRDAISNQLKSQNSSSTKEDILKKEKEKEDSLKKENQEIKDYEEISLTLEKLVFLLRKTKLQRQEDKHQYLLDTLAAMNDLFEKEKQKKTNFLNERIATSKKIRESEEKKVVFEEKKRRPMSEIFSTKDDITGPVYGVKNFDVEVDVDDVDDVDDTDDTDDTEEIETDDTDDAEEIDTDDTDDAENLDFDDEDDYSGEDEEENSEDENYTVDTSASGRDDMEIE